MKNRADAGPVDWGPLQSARWLGKAPPHLVIHARDRLLAGLTAGHFRLLTALGRHARAHLPVALVAYGRDSVRAAAETDHVHILMGDRPLYAPQVFHCVPGYLRGFWFFDEIGSRNNSTARIAPFDPRAVSGAHAEAFRQRLHDRFAARNLSKFPQNPRGADLPAGCLAFFAQGFRPPRHHRHHMTVTDMLDALIAARGDRPVVIKPHPDNTPEEVAALAARARPGVTLLTASLHDILAACAVTVSLSSACSFEGFLHGKPAVLGGQTDFAQNAVTLTDPAAMPAALAAALARPWPHARFLAWYLQKLCLQDREDDLPRLLARLHAKGIAWADPTGAGFC